jgi:lipoate-protein ligase B
MEGVSHISGHPLKASPDPFPVFDLGVAPYVPVQALQGRLRASVANGLVPGVLLLLEHEPVITLGSRAGPQDLRDGVPEGAASRGAALPVVTTERGGQATLHAPGQLVSYAIVPIPGRDLGEYVRGLEETIILVLAALGITGQRSQGRPGVYVDGEKISSLGLRCQRWVSSHGISLNVSVDLSLFDTIVSCGEPHLRQTSIERLSAVKADMAQVKSLYLHAVKQVFGWCLLPVRAVSYEGIEAELGLEA